MKTLHLLAAAVFVLVGSLSAASVAAQSVSLEAHYYPSLQRVKLSLRQNVFRTPDGQPGLEARYVKGKKFDVEPVVTRVEPFPRLDEEFLGRHVGRDNYAISWRGTFGPVLQSGVYVMSTVNDDGLRAWVDGKKIIDDWRNHPPARNTGRIRLEKGQTVPFRVDYYEDGGGDTLQVDWDFVGGDAGGDAPEVEAELQLVADDGETVLEQTIRYAPAGDTVFIDVGELDEGRYTLRVRGDADGRGDGATSTFVREVFPWENNDLGITDEVFPPFEPLVVEGDLVSPVMRRYTQGGLGLWESVEARSNEGDYRELLAGPISLIANGESLQGEGEVVRAADHEAVFEGTASSEAVQLQSRILTEYDGCARVELTLAPGDGETPLDSLVLDIPLRDEMAPLWHVCTMGLRGNPAGRTPGGEGEIWRSKGQIGSVRPHGNKQRRGNWEPYVWLGGEERGLAWFADNDAGWVPDYDNNKPSLTLHRNGGVLTLRVHLVQKPIVLDEPREIVFGLMASPAKPMPENWRNQLLGNMWMYSGKLDGYEKFSWMASQYWSPNMNFAAKYPVNKDFSVLDKMQEARERGHVDRSELDQYLDAWAERNLGENYPDGDRGPQHGLRMIEHSIVWAGRRPWHQTVYWEEFIAVPRWHEEFATFGHEWTGGSGRTPNMTDSYRDFGAYFGAEFLRRGIGLYFDNTFMEPAFDPLTTTAYRQPDGHVQPTAGIWARREYLKRIWNMHQTLPPEGTDPLMTLHMTNTHILPYMVWGDSNLDLEWRYETTPRQKAFPPDLLRAQSLGLQTGNIPQSLAENRAELSHFGTLMVHEIRSWFLHKTARSMLTRMLDFGYGKDAEVVNYWNDDPPIEISDPRCKWLLLQKDDQALLLLCTWNGEDENLRVELTNANAAFTFGTVRDAESDERIASTESVFEFEMKGYDTRLIRIGEAE